MHKGRPQGQDAIMLGFFKKVNPQLEAARAREALNARRPDEAVAICQAALKSHPDDSECRTLLARAYEQLDRVGDAIEAYETACAKAPTYPNLLAAANLYRRVGDWARAEEKFQAAVERFPTSVPAWRGLANARQRLGKLDLVARCHEMLVSLQPDSTDARLDLAEACAEAGDVRRAAELTQAILETAPENIRALHCLANCLAGQAEWDEAIRAYRRLLALVITAPDSEPAQRARLHYDLAAALRSVGNHDEALSHLQACQELQPNYLPAYRAMLEIHRLKEDFPAAIAVAEQALEREPSEPGIWLDLGHLQLAAGEPRAALDAFAKALKLKPGYTEAIAGTAEAFSAAGHHDRAKTICEKLVLKRAFQALPHLTYARVLRNAGEFRAALRQAETAVAISATNIDAQKLRDELLRILGEE